MQHDDSAGDRQANNFPDPVDRASAETDIHINDALVKQQAKAKMAQMRWPVRPDGECACGCGEDVDPRRLALGYGLTLECAARMEPSR